MNTNQFKVICVALIFILSFSTMALADNFTDTIEIYKKSPTVQPFFKSAYGFAVFPTIGKGGLGLGGAYGKGRVYRGGTVTGETSLVKVSIGFQAGGQGFSEMIFFEDKRAYDDFTSGEFEFDAAASAVAITAGAQAKTGTEGAAASASVGPATSEQAKANYRKGMAVFVHIIGGRRFEASVGGQKFKFKPNK